MFGTDRGCVRAPDAGSAALRGQWDGQQVSLTKDAEGLWSVTVPQVPAGVWEYSFVINGLAMIDRANLPSRSKQTAHRHPHSAWLTSRMAPNAWRTLLAGVAQLSSRVRSQAVPLTGLPDLELLFANECPGELSVLDGRDGEVRGDALRAGGRLHVQSAGFQRGHHVITADSGFHEHPTG
jgi:hypothetical protein